MTIARAESMRHRVWRYVRDAGKNSVVRSRVAEHFKPASADFVGRTLDGLKADKFLSKVHGRGGVFVVTEENRVPAGESMQLGAGWTDEEDDGEQEPQAAGPAAGMPLGPRSVFDLCSFPAIHQALEDAGASALAPPPEPAAAPAPREVSHVDALATWKAAPAPIAVEAAECALGPRFRAALTSDSTLELQLKTGCVVELGADDTRLLFAWFDQLRSVVRMGASA